MSKNDQMVGFLDPVPYAFFLFFFPPSQLVSEFEAV